MQAQMKAMKNKVTAAKASRRTTHGKSVKGSNQDAKDPEKQPKPKLKQTAQAARMTSQQKLILDQTTLKVPLKLC